MYLHHSPVNCKSLINKRNDANVENPVTRRMTVFRYSTYLFKFVFNGFVYVMKYSFLLARLIIVDVFSITIRMSSIFCSPLHKYIRDLRNRMHKELDPVPQITIPLSEYHLLLSRYKPLV